MAIAFGTAGTVDTGTTSCTPGLPASLAAGDIMVLCVANKYPNNAPSAITGWTQQAQISGGAGSAGVDVGTCYITVFTRAWQSGDAAPTVSVTSGNCVVARIFRYTKAADKNWSIASATGTQNTGGSNSWSCTASTNPGLTAGDMLVCAAGLNTDTAGPPSSSQAVTATGVSAWGTQTERQDSGTNQGEDVGLVVSEHPVTTGTASAAPVFTMTGTDAAGNSYAGAMVFLRLREVSAGLSATVEQVTETDLAQALGKAKLKAVGQNSETDLAQALTRVKIKGVGQPSETDLAQAVGRLKTLALGLNSEADSAFSLVSPSITVAIGLTSETDSAQVVTVAKAKALGLVTETDLAQAVAFIRKLKAIGLVSEIDSALSVTAVRSKGIGLVSETDEAQALTHSWARTIGLSSETDEAFPVTVIGVVPPPTLSGSGSGQMVISLGLRVGLSVWLLVSNIGPLNQR